MNSTLYYFSATGNSLHAAKSIAARLGDCAVKSIPQEFKQKAFVADTQVIGFVFPLHAFGLPLLVEEFIETLDLSFAEYIFAVVTCGSHYIGGSLHQLKTLLVRQGQALAAGFYVDMLSNYIPLFDLPSKEKQQQRLAKADTKLVQINSKLAAKQRIIEPELFWWPAIGVNKTRRKHPPAKPGFFRSSACTACGLCRTICPVDNIEWVNDSPHWRQPCMECLACLHACPVSCIELRSRTAGRQRYRHPQISLEEILQANQ